ncbi:MAG: hypothetical protein ACFE95_09790 [Candidatus Hodarchaeota archaeon]
MTNNGKQTRGTLMTNIQISNLRDFVTYVKGLKKIVDVTIEALASEPIPQFFLEIRKHFAESSNELEKFRKGMDSQLKNIVKDHQYPECEKGTLALQFISSTRCGYSKGQADFIQQLSNNLVNAIRSMETVNAGVRDAVLNIITESGLEDIHESLKKQFPPATSESVRVK